MPVESVFPALERLLPNVQKPVQYVGGELNAVVKDWDSVDVRWVLMYPDAYEVGLPNQGVQILYEVLNERDDVLCERTYSVWPDLEQLMRGSGVPQFTLDAHRPVGAFDVFGLSFATELGYTNMLTALDLAGIPLHAVDRDDSHPIVIAGGHAAFNPEPIATFIDCAILGDGEEAALRVSDIVADWKRGWDHTISASAFSSLSACDTSSVDCGTGRSVAMLATVWTSSDAPSCASASSSEPAVSSPAIVRVSVPNTGPVSKPASILNVEAPVTSSPAMIARCTGAAPRHCGSNEKCRLIQPCSGMPSISAGTRPPYATTGMQAGAIRRSSSAMSASFAGLSTRSPRDSANAATGDGVRIRPRPAGASGRVMTASTS